MKLSTVVLTASTVVSAIAESLHHKVVAPSLRSANKLKSVGLEQAFQETDVQYWKSVDYSVNLRKLALQADKNITLASKARDLAHKATVSHAKVKVA